MNNPMERTYRLRGEIVREVIKDRKLKMKAIANEVGVTPKALRDWINKGKPAYAENALALARAIGVRAQDVLDGFQPQVVQERPELLNINAQIDPSSPKDFMLLSELLARAHAKYEAYQEAKELASTNAINVYLVPGKDRNGEPAFTFVIVSKEMHSHFMASLETGVVPDFAIVVAAGYGEPGPDVKEYMRKYYGFDYAQAKVATE